MMKTCRGLALNQHIWCDAGVYAARMADVPLFVKVKTALLRDDDDEYGDDEQRSPAPPLQPS